MKRTFFAGLTAVAIVGAASVTASAALRESVEQVHVSAASAVATPVAGIDSPPLSASGDGESGEFSAAGSLGVVHPVQGGRAGSVVTTLPAASSSVATLEVQLDVVSQRQYDFWSYGVLVSAGGLVPGEQVTVAMTTQSGKSWSWSTLTANAQGRISQRLRYLEIEPDNNRPEIGLHQLSVRAASGAAGSRSFQITANPNDVLRVSVSHTQLTQDQFFNTPVRIRATGLQPNERMFFNLGAPDGSGSAVGVGEGLRADKLGVFTYELQGSSVNTPTGEWIFSLQSYAGKRGSATLTVTEGASRAEQMSVAFDLAQIPQSQFASPGIGYQVRDFRPFETYQMSLTTSRGRVFDLGSARANGQGRGSDLLSGPSTAPPGRYTLMLRSTTTGNYAIGHFLVIGANGQAPDAPALTPSVTTVGAATLADPARGLNVSGTGFVPQRTYVVELRDARWDRVSLRTGASIFATADATGTLRFTLATRVVIAAGSYTLRAWADSSAIDAYDVRTALTVTGDVGPSVVVPAAPRFDGPPAAPGEVPGDGSAATVPDQVPTPTDDPAVDAADPDTPDPMAEDGDATPGDDYADDLTGSATHVPTDPRLVTPGPRGN